MSIKRLNTLTKKLKHTIQILNLFFGILLFILDIYYYTNERREPNPLSMNFFTTYS